MLPVHLVQKFMKQLSGKVFLVVYNSKEMLEFVEKLAEVSSNVEYEFNSNVEPTLKLPAIGFRDAKIFFHCVPKYAELESFLAAMKVVARLKREENVSCTVITFVSQFCPNCRASVDALNKLAVQLGIEHHIVDVSMFPDFANKYDVASVPTTYICDLRFVGVLSEDEAKMWIEEGAKQNYYEYFAEKLKNGEIEVVKDVAAKKGLGRVLAELMAHREFMVRLGAMAALESLSKDRKDIAEQAKEVIVKLLKHEDERIREDAAMMLGIIGSSEDIKHLAELAKEGGRVGMSAEEAIKIIRGKESG